MENSNGEILINEEALKKINASTLKLKGNMSDVLKNVSDTNKDFISQSKGQYADTFKNVTDFFESEMSEQVNKLNEINDYAQLVLESNMELDQELANAINLK